MRAPSTESFPPSTVAALPLVASEGGRLLVDATDVVLRDLERRRAHAGKRRTGKVHGGARPIERSTRRTRRPSRRTPRSTPRSPSRSRAASRADHALASCPTARAFTLRQHSRCSRCPTTAITRARSIRASATSASTFKDYAQPIQRAARAALDRAPPARARRTRTIPTAPIKNPIVYYVDRGIPEPIRTATLEGVQLVGAGVRSRGAQGRLPVEHAARRRRSDGRALQRRAVGEPQRARLVGRRRARAIRAPAR